MDDHREGIREQPPIPPWEWPDSREDIQVEKPVPPWERPGCFRLDCEPHRATLLNVMGYASVIVAVLAPFLPLVLAAAGSRFGFLATLLAGLPISTLLSLTTWLMARSDLAKMQLGRMGRGGEGMIIGARINSLTGLALNLCCGVVWGASFIAASLMRV